MPQATAQVGESKILHSGKHLLRASLGGTFESGDIDLIISWASALRSEIERLAAGKPKSVCVLVDVHELGVYTDTKFLSILADVMKKDESYIYKTASWGGSVIHEMAQQILKTMSKRDNLKNWKTEAEALEWLGK